MLIYFSNKLEQFKFSEEFKLDGLDDWMETSDISAPTSGKGIGLSNDGFGELEGTILTRAYKTIIFS